jgi:hypothetical protein
VRTQLPADRRLAECSGLYALYLANGRPRMPSALQDTSIAKRLYPPVSYYQMLRPTGLQLRRHASRWRFGEADTTGTIHKPARQRETLMPDGQRVVETRRTERTYYANGTLKNASRRRRLIGLLVRSYYPGGHRQEVVKYGLFGTSTRKWDESGQLVKKDYTSALPSHPGRTIRLKLWRLHPLKSIRRKLRQFHPLRPVYRKLRRAFQKPKHHTHQSR